MNISNVQGASAYSSIASTNADAVAKSSQNTLIEESAKNVDTFNKSEAETESVTYAPPKKLTQAQLEEINRQSLENNLKFLADMVGENISAQSAQVSSYYDGFELSEDSTALLTEIFGSLEAALPVPATTAEGALADISEGGAYSVEAVSDRIMTMANFFADGDLDVLAEMKDAVMKGFEEAGLNLETGEGMPDITMDTYEHVMKEFDSLLNPETQEVPAETEK